MSALSGLRIVELGIMVAGPYCGKLFADLGADVVKVESPAGDPARRRGPFPGATPHRERSGLFLYLNTNKRSICLDLGVRGGRESLHRLIAGADVLIDNLGAGVLEAHDLGWPALQQLNAGLVYTCITAYGRSGPRRDVPGDELTLVQAGGLGTLLPSRSQDVSRPPIKLGGYAVGYHGGLLAAVATLGAVRRQRRSGHGALVDVSLQEVILAMVAPLVASHRYHGTSWSRVPDRPPAMGRMQTKDGYIILNAFDDHHFAALVELMGRPNWCAGEEWQSMTYRSHHLMDIAPQLDAWVAEQDKEDLHRRAGKAGIPIGPISTAADVLQDPQYAARSYFVEAEHADAGRLRYAGWPYRMTASKPAIRRPAPRLGEHSAEVLDAGDGESERPVPSPSSTADQLPLQGVRILEFCWVWAGPYAGRLLAALGAEVIKVESHRRTDLTRRAVVWPLPEPAPRSVSPNQGMAFNSVNLNKKSLTLDLRRAEGVELARRLAAESDVVVDNMRPGALGKLGLGPEDLRRLRAELIVASSSGRGRGGPQSEYLGYAMVHQGIGGGAYITGYPDDHPCHSGGDVDLMNAAGLAFSILAALAHRDRTGSGQTIDYSQCEGVTSLLGEVFLGCQMTGEVPERMGNADPFHAPHNVYPAWGVNRWLALEVHDDEEFARLAEVLGRGDLCDDARYATAVARKQNEEALDAEIRSWTARRDRDWMVAQLAAAGLRAAPCRDAADLYADPHLKERGAFVTVDHPEVGEIELVEVPWRIEGCPAPARPAPLLGEHNGDILETILGLSPAELEELRAKDVIRG